MTEPKRLAFLRHGVTGWNREGRIQGHTDIPLDAEGRAHLGRLVLPAGWGRRRCTPARWAARAKPPSCWGAAGPCAPTRA